MQASGGELGPGPFDIKIGRLDPGALGVHDGQPAQLEIGEDIASQALDMQASDRTKGNALDQALKEGPPCIRPGPQPGGAQHQQQQGQAQDEPLQGLVQPGRRRRRELGLVAGIGVEHAFRGEGIGHDRAPIRSSARC